VGQKVNPVGLRLALNKDWSSKWFASKKHYAEFLHEDLKIRKFIFSKVPNGEISKIQIERPSDNRIKITIHSSKVGIVIGKGGKEVQDLKDELEHILDPELKHKNRKTEPPKREVFINIREVKEPLKEAKLVALGIVAQLERRVSFRRAMKKMLERAQELNIPGMKIAVSGRLGGAEIARTEWYLHGRVPLHTLKADVDFAIEEAKTTYGIIGVKVWVYRGIREDAHEIDSNLGQEMVAAQ